MSNYLAHVRKDENGNWIQHSLEEHLQAVATLAENFASTFDSAEWAFLAGIWHDLGKYKSDFQTYIRSASGYNPDAHLENTPGKVDHSTAGAIHAVSRHGGVGKILAYLIAGHHAGLPDWLKAEAEGRGLEERLNDKQHLEETKKAPIPEEILNAAMPKSRPPPDPEHAHLWIRMLFSSLVDADFLDTEAFMDPKKSALRGSTTNLKALLDVFNIRNAERNIELQEKKLFDLPVNKIRRQVLEDCIGAGKLESGFFSLTVPTGGGKTLSSVAFALEHSLKHNKRRIVVAIPFTSIIEQTAQELIKIFGSVNVLEHHSNLDLDRETPKGRLSSENWDVPIVVTTNVQLFESLFAARTSRCRKLHNLANSVIILDEAQMLPPEKLAPTLSVLKGLVAHFGCTVVLCTATQPALIGDIGSGKVKFNGINNVREIIRDPINLAHTLRRVALRVYSDERVDWATLSQSLAKHSQVLCIVNRRQDCRDLWEAVQKHTGETPVHLSALMCGVHRSQVVAQIKDDLQKGNPLRVISTQLVEAGVDIDFPVVYRAMAGLDSIAQAAGRCNREGRLNLDGKLGDVVIFHPPKPSPQGLLRKGEDAGAEVMRTAPELAHRLAPEAFQRYFHFFYGRVNDFGKDIFKQHLIVDAGRCQFQFRSAALWYQLIDEQGYRGIVVWHATSKFTSQEIIEEVTKYGPTRERMRRLQRFTVNVPQIVWQKLRDQGVIMEVIGPEGALGLWAQCVSGLYDYTFGLRIDGPVYDGTEFIY